MTDHQPGASNTTFFHSFYQQEQQQQWFKDHQALATWAVEPTTQPVSRSLPLAPSLGKESSRLDCWANSMSPPNRMRLTTTPKLGHAGG
ncbi:hypothetical protein CEP54_011301 [Fusarium duplospermum]|uniref:Uncharacterized protein n=1 Tax=Fusarium duplospermum TaxID=1325734 RepID=A0A428PF40_9HYPO|nr:hypothetical protein CEP54_011301 [Fusarium duplospermum]